MSGILYTLEEEVATRRGKERSYAEHNSATNQKHKFEVKWTEVSKKRFKRSVISFLNIFVDIVLRTALRINNYDLEGDNYQYHRIDMEKNNQPTVEF